MRINFNPKTFYNPALGKINRNFAPSFCASADILKAPVKDAFAPKIIETKINGYGNIKGIIYSNFILADMFDREVPGVILKDSVMRDTFYACAKDGENYEGLARMSFYEEDDEEYGKNHLYISALYGDPHNRKYFGAGTELLKTAARESIKRGFGGKVELIMTGSFPFYHKNNFRMLKDTRNNLNASAFLDFATRRNLNPSLYWEKKWGQDMKLDEEGAKALLDDMQYFRISKSKIIGPFEISYHDNMGNILTSKGYIDLADLSDGKIPAKYVLQYIEDDFGNIKQRATLPLTVNPSDKKIFKTGIFKCDPPKDDVSGEFQKAIRKEFKRIIHSHKNSDKISFTGSNSSEDKKVLFDSKEYTGKKIKDITLRDNEDNPVDGWIFQDNKSKHRYFACVRNRAICEMNIGDDYRGWIYIYDIYRAENSKNIKGGGSELLKLAIKKSVEKGYKGKVKLYMAGSYPFYYKNNFRMNQEERAEKGDYLKENALLSFITRHNIKTENIINRFVFPFIALDEEGAEALLEGKRFYKEEKGETLLKIKVADKNRIIDWSGVKINNGGAFYVIQIIDEHLDGENKGKFEQKSAALVSISEDKSTMEVFIEDSPEEEFKLISDAAKKKAKDMNICNVKIN